MRLIRIERVARSVQIDRKQVDCVQAELLSVGLRLHQQHLFRHPVRSVGLLRVAVPEIFLAKRYRGYLWIGTDRTEGDDLFHLMEARLLDHLDAHLHIFIEEPAGILPVRSDPAYDSRQMDHQLRSRIGKQSSRLGRDAKVVFVGAEYEQMLAADGFEGVGDMAAEETVASGNQNPL